MTAIVKPFALDDVKDGLRAICVHGMTVTQARGFGRQRGHGETHRGAEHRIDLVPKVRIEVLVGDVLADRVVEVLMESARTGTSGDGKIWVTQATNAYRIGAGEIGEAAI